MTDFSEETDKRPDRLRENLEKIDELTQRLVAAMSSRRESDPGLQGPGQELFLKAATAYVADMMANPAKMLEQQVAYWGQSLKHWAEAQEALSDGGEGQSADPSPKGKTDRRFSNELWQTNPFFNFVKQQYTLNSGVIENAIGELDGLDIPTKRRVEFFTRQIIDMMSPTNFLGTNPDALQKAVETDGQSLVDGLENLVRDIETNQGDLAVTLSDPEAFEVGQNIGATAGSVVFQNRMFQLIQYQPTTEKVHKAPLIIFPPWINKFYVLDLKQQNSLIKWVLDQGYSLFVVSWANPDASYADVGLDTYLNDGFLTAIAEVKNITGEAQVNAVGYCIAGTMLSVTLGFLAKKKDKSVRSATFLTTVADFSDPGEMSVFVEEDFLRGIENEVDVHGFLNAFFMQRTFSYLRANDLVYGPAIRSYMMGEAPPAFDLLFWNGDGTNLPGRLAKEYLRELCQENRLMNDQFEIAGEDIRLGDIKVPICAVACQTDHIAEWNSSFRGLSKTKGSQTFILSESGHIAGIVNPPAKDKYGHWTNEDKMVGTESWFNGATFHKGSWWPRWEQWLKGRSGAMIPARAPGDNGQNVIEPAPGSYVMVKSNRL